MPWVRIDENAMEHPKVTGLGDGAFRLWVQGLAHCQKFLTDGFIAEKAARGLRAYSPKRKTELMAAILWEQSEAGIRVHDYLQWNESREHVVKVRELAKDRLRRMREKRGTDRVTERVSSPVANALRPTANASVGGVVLTPQAASEGKGEAGETTPEQRAGAFCQWYEDTHDRLVGVGYMGTQRDYQSALQLCAKFTDADLRDAALVWFGMDDDFAKNGTRTVPKFASRVTSCLQIIQARGLSA